MFERKKCNNCENKVKDDWDFCPRCGNSLKERNIPKMDKEFRSVENLFGPGFHVRVPNRGVSVTITSVKGHRPKISVRPDTYKVVHPIERKPIKEIRIPSVTMEPNTKIETVGNKKIIIVQLPDVKEEDIEIKELEQSMEIKAFAGDKAYFKVIPLKHNTSITNEEFRDGVLKLEIQG
jgi:HSP20 family molecular chaperone IbpA